MDTKSDHIIKNFDVLATSDSRRQLLTIAEAGYAAINTKNAIKKILMYDPKKHTLVVQGKKFDLVKFQRVICVGFGKAALEAVTEIQSQLKDVIKCGFVIDLKEGSLGNIVCKVGTHPYPTKVNIEATKELMAMLEAASEEDLVICVVSGGGSALLCYPHDMDCETEVGIISALTVKGATIQELNTVRKHISSVKGGNLAKIIYPATCISLIFSDVPGDDMGMVASGPTIKDTTTSRDASLILSKYDVLKTLDLPSVKLLETPKEEKYFSKIHNVLAVSARQALVAMEEKAEDLGFKAIRYSAHFQGEAREIGKQITQLTKQGECLLGTGETTVTIHGKGIGGRNQEMALGGLPFIAEYQAFGCFASDGHDNSEFAGAIVDRSTLIKSQALKINPQECLDNNDSFHFFERVSDGVITGLTGSNVADFFVNIRAR